MQNSSDTTLSTSISRWRTARKIILGSIILAGSMATSAALLQRYAGTNCKAQRTVAERGYTYSGIGAVIQQRGEFVVVRDVLPGAPADGVLREGMHLVSVDGMYPVSVEDWAAALRGPAGTSVTIEVATRCSGHKFVTLDRQLIRVQK
ncbi:PDZ domain-containing protein [Nannocystis punicea]|uniref:PDZ domain-containing protein n=1 Tax=Nannocystis punicea TaxID=2995304 RepID=A0ABY7H254_9BACT|nr:PDZ domain-containing protein [Nannocystis poenicansa]WAS93308.1 PDZ domain-containing protein [Nannocystis poenicansa]